MKTIHDFDFFLPWAGPLKVRVETKSPVDPLDIRAYADFLLMDGRGSRDLARAIASKFGAHVDVLVVADSRRYSASSDDVHNPYLVWSIRSCGNAG